jgi:tetratricopeptide (TPR) repeat protein
LLELSKNIAYTFDLLAQGYIAQNKEDVALNCYNIAIEIYPNCESALPNLGLLHMKFAQYNLTINLEDCAVSFGFAEKFIKRTLEISSENPLFLQSVASWYEQYIELLEKVDGNPQQIQQNIIRNFDYALQYYFKAFEGCVDNPSLKAIIQVNLTECLVQYGH